MAMGFTPGEEALFYRTGEELLARLEGTRDPAALLAVIRSAYAEFQRAYDAAPAAARAAVACRAGCGTCCHNEVAAQAHEILIVAEHVQKHWSAAELDALVAATRAHQAEYFAGRDDPRWNRPKTPCVFLRDGSCSVYEARPGICRAYHSNSVEGCIANLAAGYEKVDVKIRGLRGRMFAVMHAIDHAVGADGFDDRAYDFGSALHEALTDSLCAARWMRREPAFPDRCLERGE